MKVGINGMGRIGRLALRAALERNRAPVRRSAGGQPAGGRSPQRDQGARCGTAHLLAFDSVQGRWRADIPPTATVRIRIDETAVFAPIPARPTSLGRARRRCGARMHGKVPHPETLQGPPGPRRKRVIVAAPVKTGGVLNIVVGINHEHYDPARDRIVTAALRYHQLPGAGGQGDPREPGHPPRQITTIHDPTNTNLVVDAPHKDLRRARSAP